MSKICLRHTLIKKYPWHFSWLLYLYTVSLFENASLIIVSAETEYISTRSWYRNINYLRDRIRRILYSPGPVACFSNEDDVSGNQNNCYWPLHSESIVYLAVFFFTLIMLIFLCLDLGKLWDPVGSSQILWN
jgi:hypothetical protein